MLWLEAKNKIYAEHTPIPFTNHQLIISWSLCAMLTFLILNFISWYLVYMCLFQNLIQYWYININIIIFCFIRGLSSDSSSEESLQTVDTENWQSKRFSPITNIYIQKITSATGEFYFIAYLFNLLITGCS